MSESTNVAAVLDRAPVNPYHLRILGLCTFTLFVDGFDLLAMSAAAPSVASALQVPPAQLGPALSVSLLGAAIGGVCTGPIGDRVGRRPLLVAMFVLAAIATAATAFGRTLDELVILRFATGLFVGGAIPPALALAAEFMPAARRQLMLIVMVSGAPFGSMCGSLIAPTLIEQSGWPAIFVFAGGLCLVCAITLAIGLPESLRFLVLKKKPRAAVAAVYSRIVPGSDVDVGLLSVAEPESRNAPGGRLFANGQAPTTMLLWIVYFGTQSQLYFLGSWLPTLFREAGLPLATALYGTMAHQGGGVIGSWVFGLWSDRKPPQRVMAWMYALAIVTIAPLGFVIHSLPLVFLFAVLSGVGAVGAQSCLHAFAASVYPTAMRTTGVGWAVSFGRLGSIISPFAGGLMLGAGMTVQQILIAATVFPTICLFGVEALRRVQAARAGQNSHAEQLARVP